MTFGQSALRLDCDAETDRIVQFIKSSASSRLHRKGLVVAISGGVDSCTTAALCAKALGPERVFGLLMPERDSMSDTLELAKIAVGQLRIPYAVVDITDQLSAAGCYRARDEVVQRLCPEFDPGAKFKILPSRQVTDGRSLSFYTLVVETKDGRTYRCRLSAPDYRAIIAATNMKQRTRKALEYYHADRLNYGVAGTANLPEREQGFFVRGGDGLADIFPIAHLYKTQVYALGAHLDLPQEVITRVPTTDTFSMEQSQEEFFFGLPYEQVDLLLYGLSQCVERTAIVETTGLDSDQLNAVLDDIERKRVVSKALQMQALTLTPGTQPGNIRI